MKKFDVLVWALLAIGGLNWGLVGLFDFNLVSAIFGEMSGISRLIYIAVGLAAAYDVLFVKTIWKRWGIHLFEPAHS